jgi:hypothetical protein
LIRDYVKRIENPLEVEAKDPPKMTPFGLVTDISCKIGVFAGLIGLICGDAQNLTLCVKAWREIKFAFSELNNAYAGSLEELGVEDMEEVVEAEKIEEDFACKSFVLLGHLKISSKKRSQAVQDELAGKDTLYVQSPDWEDNYCYFGKFGKLMKDEDRILIGANVANNFGEGEEMEYLKAQIRNGNIILEEEIVIQVPDDNLKLSPRKINVVFSSVYKPEKENKLIKLAAVGDKIANFIETHHEKFVVATFVVGSILTAGVAGLIYQYSDKIHYELASAGCEVASPIVIAMQTKPALPAPVKKEAEEEKPTKMTKAEVMFGLACRDADLMALYMDMESIEFEGGKKNLSSGDRAKINQREHQREKAREDWREFKEKVKHLKTDFEREDVISALVAERDMAENAYYDFGKHANVSAENYERGKQALWEQLNRIKGKLFEMYDMYQKTENTSKVTYTATVNPLPNWGSPKPAQPVSVDIAWNALPNTGPIFVLKADPEPEKPKKKVKPLPAPKVKVSKPVVPSVEVKPIEQVLSSVEAPSDVKTPTENKKKRRGRRGKGKAKKAAAKLAKEANIQTSSGWEADPPRSYAAVAKKPKAEKPKDEAGKQYPGKAQKPTLKSVNPERPKPVCYKCGGPHVISVCPNKPDGYKIFTKEEWEKMEPAEKRKAVAKNRQLVPRPVVSQSVSLHDPVKGKLPVHENLVPIFLPGCNNPGKHSEYWGTMLKAKHLDVTYVMITEHQLKEKVYYIGNDLKPHEIPSADKWSKFGEGKLAYYRIPADKLQAISKGANLKVGDPFKGTQNVAMFVGIDPMTLEPICAATSYSYAGGEVEIVHNTSTQNFSCGNFLIDSKSNTCIGLHFGTIGPSKKHGDNNLMIPLKQVGLRRVGSP